MDGAIPLFPLCTFMACTVTTLHFGFLVQVSIGPFSIKCMPYIFSA